jgi:hypothetical protein
MHRTQLAVNKRAQARRQRVQSGGDVVLKSIHRVTEEE